MHIVAPCLIKRSIPIFLLYYLSQGGDVNTPDPRYRIVFQQCAPPLVDQRCTSFPCSFRLHDFTFIFHLSPLPHSSPHSYQFSRQDHTSLVKHMHNIQSIHYLSECISFVHFFRGLDEGLKKGCLCISDGVKHDVCSYPLMNYFTVYRSNLSLPPLRFGITHNFYFVR